MSLSDASSILRMLRKQILISDVEMERHLSTTDCCLIIRPLMIATTSLSKYGTEISSAVMISLEKSLLIYNLSSQT